MNFSTALSGLVLAAVGVGHVLAVTWVALVIVAWPGREEGSGYLAGTGRTNAKDGAIAQKKSSITGATARETPSGPRPPILAVRTGFSSVVLLS
jgi:hypothetical protein